MEIVRYADRDDLREQRRERLNEFPAYLNHNSVGSRYWGRLYTDFPELQLAVTDGGALVGEVHAVPVPVNGDELPAGWDEAFERGMENGGGNVVSLLAMSVRPDARRKGIPTLLITAVRRIARETGHEGVIAPVRPTLKCRYPLVPIERYIGWRREDGSHFDPWIRAHEREGGTIAGPAPESLVMRAPVADWEEWLDFALPEDGTYVHPDMLAPLVVQDGIGTHAEPNVWIRHSV
jgi:GNAT superfamily N-acetyltransferase